jgi:hypothetical protein
MRPETPGSHASPPAIAPRSLREGVSLGSNGYREARIMTDGIDPELLLGNLALEAGMITPDQLKVALGDQSRDLDSGRAPRQLGIILLARHWLSEDQLMELLRVQSDRRARRKTAGGG